MIRTSPDRHHGTTRHRAWIWLLGLTAGATVLSNTLQAQTSAPVPVVAGPVVERVVGQGRDFVGTVTPIRKSTVGSAVDERVVEFPVREGDRVEKGQVLAQLRTQPLDIQLSGAKAELEARRQELAEMENGSLPEEIDQAQANAARAKALMDYARLARERMERLVRTRSASPEELDESISNYEQANQAHRQALAELALVEMGPRKEQIAQARYRVVVQEEAIRQLEDQLAEHTILAPFAGYITAEHTEVGQWVSKGDDIVELVELDRIDITVNVLEDYIRHVRVGTTARAEVGALPNEAFVGEVALIVPQAELRSRTFPVKVRIENEMQNGVVALKAGMLARVTLPVGQERRSLLVDKDALVLGGETPIVHVIEPASNNPQRGTVQPVPVRLGVADGSLIAIEGELRVGQFVVVQGNERLPRLPRSPAQEVEIIETLMIEDDPTRTADRPGRSPRARTFQVR